MTRDRLSRAAIVAAAMKLADREGLEAVTLRRIAATLGVHVTSLYNHVPTKEAVLDGMIECLIAEARLPEDPIPWQEWVRRFAASLRSVALKHPGAFAALHHRPIQGAKAAASMEVALASFREAGFGVLEAYSAVKSAMYAVLGVVLEELAGVKSTELSTDMSVLPREQFPQLHAANRVAARANPSKYLIEALIAGIATNHAARAKV